jgi:hypothetical protein
MNLQPFAIAIAGFGVLNGLFSPLLVQVVGAMIVLAPGFFAPSAAILFFVSSLVLSTLTIMVAGVPAALYERLTGAATSTPASMWIWLAATALLTIPAIHTFLAVGF